MKLLRFESCIIAASFLLVASLASPALGQTYKPAAEIQSLLNMRFYEGDAGFLVEDVQIVFPPATKQSGSFVISKASGEEVLSLPLRMEPFGGFPTFANLKPDGHPGNIKVSQSGDFVMTIKLGGEVITRMPFSLKEERGNDPYNPQRRFVREGPWRDSAYISAPVDDPAGHIFFHWWMSLREVPPGVSRPLASLHLLHGAKEIGTTRSGFLPSTFDWGFFSKDLVTVVNVPNPHYLTMADLAKDGEYTMILKIGGQPVKSYKFQVKGGQVQLPDQSRIDYEPHANFISPRYIDTKSGTGSRYAMHHMYWMKKSGR